jgi:hypothetical protein
MLDVTLSILALIAGGVTMELFSPANLPVLGAVKNSSSQMDDFQTGNPS